ncbi:hypothetical protein PPACK8108_LOCUS14559 [Phakopsora pachyrhizi]|uniref:Secreted protein n=1 Tax=Phakopsora pachyrhizi TaxID=170000 RepID=A0AAV0B531_PHAPC|nr:hypothetical protein PPACK8108_LOCUS14559 [Phakopsora pachyrhizi]
MVVWLMFLFSFVGIVASDFFCPNLSTLSNRLGLNKNLGGVSECFFFFKKKTSSSFFCTGIVCS